MSELERKIRSAQRCLWLNRWLVLLGWCAAVAGGLYVLAILPNKFFALTQYEGFYSVAALAAAAAALVGSAVWFLATREDRRTAAIALDVAAGLKERLSSGLYCAKLDDPFARAVYRDAERAGRSVTPSRHLRVVFPRSGGYAIGTIVLAMIVTFAVPPLDLLGKQEQRSSEVKQKEAVKVERQEVRRLLAERIEKITKENPLLQKMDGLENLDPLGEAKAETPTEVRQQAVKKIDNLVKSVEEQRLKGDQMQLDALKRMMRRASDLQGNQDPSVAKLNQAMATGDFKAAREAVDELRKRLADAAKTPEQQAQAEALQKQLAELSKRLEQAAEAVKIDKKTAEQLAKAGIQPDDVQKNLARMSKEDIEKIVKQLQEKGVSKEEAQKIAKQLEQQKKASEACKKMAQGLGKGASKSSSGSSATAGDGSSADMGMAMADQQLGEMEQLQQELNDMAGAMAALNELKDQLGKGCSQCNGTGVLNGKPCGKCGGSGLGQSGGAGGSGPGMGGLGIGQGGVAPKSEAVGKTTPEKARVFTEKGVIVGQSWVDGEQIRGDATPEFRRAVIAAREGHAEAVESGRVPRQYQKATQRYFQRVVPEAGGGARNEPSASPEGGK